MSIRIVNPDKQKVIEKDGSKFFYTFRHEPPFMIAITKCLVMILIYQDLMKNHLDKIN